MTSDPLWARRPRRRSRRSGDCRAIDASYADHPGDGHANTRDALRAAGLRDDGSTSRSSARAPRSRRAPRAAGPRRHVRRAVEGAAEAIAQIEHRALLTEHPEGGAEPGWRSHRTHRASFPRPGAFGCEAETAPAIGIARREPALACRARPSPSATPRRTSRSSSRGDPRHRLGPAWKGRRRTGRCREPPRDAARLSAAP